jgi:glycerol uptake facilitator-like aquaporin
MEKIKLNPAVVIGASIMGMIPTSVIWVYLVANFAGAAAAAIIFRVVNDELED